MTRQQKGETAHGTCNQCGSEHTYVWQGRPKDICAACKMVNIKASRKRSAEELHYKDGEIGGLGEKSIGALAKCNYREAARKLAVWEAFEKMLATKADEVAIEPISHQAVQQIERRALKKIRKAMGAIFREHQAISASHSGTYVGVNRHGLDDAI